MHVLFAKIQVQKAMELESLNIYLFIFCIFPKFFTECLTVTFLLYILPGITHKLYMCNCAEIRHYLSEECRMWNP